MAELRLRVRPHGVDIARTVRCRRGAIAVETALIVAVLLVPLLLGGFEFGRLLMAQNRLQDGVRSAVSFAIGPAGATVDRRADCDTGPGGIVGCRVADSVHRAIDGLVDASVGADATVAAVVECFCFPGGAPQPAPHCHCDGGAAVRYLTITAEHGYDPLFLFFLGDGVRQLAASASLRLGGVSGTP